MKIRFSIGLFILVNLLQAQMPDTDLWLFKLSPDKNKKLFPDSPVNITSRPGYDNQPAFSENGKGIYYVSVRDDKQADIYYYNIDSKKHLRVTTSRESEYSPVPRPETKLLNVVMVEADSSQRIHFVNLENGSDSGRLEMDSVGYYTFLNKDSVVYYKLTAPHSLWLHAAGSEVDFWLGNSPTRTFKAFNRHTLIYGLKDSLKVTFYKYNFLIRKAIKYCEYPSLNEDVIWHQSLGLMKSEETRIFRFDESSGRWELWCDLALFGIKKITRFAFDPLNKYLVVVNNI